jgi:hypothetical protein
MILQEKEVEKKKEPFFPHISRTHPLQCVSALLGEKYYDKFKNMGKICKVIYVVKFL